MKSKRFLRSGRFLGILPIALIALSSSGCNPVVEKPEFHSNRPYSYKLEIENELKLDPTLADVQVVLTELFGTATEPKLPKIAQEGGDLAGILKLESLKQCVTPPEGQEYKEALYFKNCNNCHAPEGSGRGPGSAGVDPYPRDFRVGAFKYKSTSRLSKPLKSDLVRTLRYGLPGSGMGAYDKLSDAEREALIEYVVYLSWRGEVERKLMDYAIENFEFPSEPSEGEEKPADSPKADRWVKADASGKLVIDEEKQEVIDEIVSQVGEAWKTAEEQLTSVERPTDFPILEAKVTDWDALSKNEAQFASVKRGKVLFLGAQANCASCHGPGGLGDGRTNDYDDWTKEWTARISIDPTDKDAILPFLLRGALPPKNIKPRNLREGVFRGGSTPEDLYRRLRNGIPHAPMPEIVPVSSPDQVGVTEADLWHLINYLYAMPAEPKPWPAAPVTPPTDAAVTLN